MAKKISMQHIAVRLGVSKYTVSQALAGKTGVSETTRKQVIAMARALGYSVQDAAEPATASSPSKPSHELSEIAPFICVWITAGHLDEPTFWQRVLDGVKSGTREYGWHVHIQTIPEDNPNVDITLGSNITDSTPPTWIGHIIVGTCSTAFVLAIAKQGLPFVLVDHEEPLAAADSIVNDNQEAARIACSHLLSQGCRKLVFVGKDSFSVSFRDRWWGCRVAFDTWVQKLEDRKTYSLKKWSVPYRQRGWNALLLKKLDALTAEDHPDGFICANDSIALQLLQVLRAQGYQIPVSCRVVGIDNILASASSEPPLTTVDLAKEWLGYRAVEALVRRMERQGLHTEKITLTSRLIVRSSG